MNGLTSRELPEGRKLKVRLGLFFQAAWTCLLIGLWSGGSREKKDSSQHLYHRLFVQDYQRISGNGTPCL